jgi:folate-binding protein YgfZ
MGEENQGMTAGDEDFCKAREVYAEARARGALVDMGRALWRIEGADRVRYLNGQVTNDMRRVGAGAACVTTAKGKLCGVIYVSALAEALRMDAELVLRETLTARLERYIIADDVRLIDTTDEECLLHVVGGEGPEEIAGAEVRAAMRFARAGWDVIGPVAGKAELIAALTSRHVLLDKGMVESMRIEAGVPRWGAELTEDTLPPEARLDVAAIDYHKGCYIGQEVISRIKSVGHVNRVLTGFLAEGRIEAGFTLHPDAEPGQTAGQITSGAWSFGLETWAGLGYLKRTFAAAPLHARAPDGASIPIQTRELPLCP